MVLSKIGGFGVPAGWTASVTLQPQFEALDDRNFSLGQDATYYANLAALGPDIRIQVLEALKDLAYNPHLLQRAQDEHVTQTSLMRNMPLGVVGDQLRRIAHGGARVTSYEITYQPGGGFQPGRPVWS